MPPCAFFHRSVIFISTRDVLRTEMGGSRGVCEHIQNRLLRFLLQRSAHHPPLMFDKQSCRKGVAMDYARRVSEATLLGSSPQPSIRMQDQLTCFLPQRRLQHETPARIKWRSLSTSRDTYTNLHNCVRERRKKNLGRPFETSHAGPDHTTRLCEQTLDGQAAKRFNMLRSVL